MPRQARPRKDPPRRLLAALALVTGQPAPPNTSEPAELNSAGPEVTRAKARHVPDAPEVLTPPAWTQMPGIQGFGIAEKNVGGRPTGELALKVYVATKLEPSALPLPVPPFVEVPGVRGLVPTDVEAIGTLGPQSYTGRVRPAIPGVSIGTEGGPPGTGGCLVRDASDPMLLYALSNYHVLAARGAGEGAHVMQPAGPDGGYVPQAVIGALARWEPIVYSNTGFDNVIDAALARVDSKLVSPNLASVGAPPAGWDPRIVREMPVTKVGRTTGRTYGVVKDTNFHFNGAYPKPNGTMGRAGFRFVVLCTRFTDGGDSGSIVLNNRGMVVGLHFYGSASTSVFCRIEHVLNLLNVQLVT